VLVTNYDRADTGGRYKPAPVGWAIADATAILVTMPVGIFRSIVRNPAVKAYHQKF
jgi:hypothetical protein